MHERGLSSTNGVKLFLQVDKLFRHATPRVREAAGEVMASWLMCSRDTIRESLKSERRVTVVDPYVLPVLPNLCC